MRRVKKHWFLNKATTSRKVDPHRICLHSFFNKKSLKRFGCLLSVAVVAVSLITTSGIASADTSVIDSMSLADKTQSYYYYKALSQCFTDYTFAPTISTKSGAKTGDWFDNNQKVSVTYLSDNQSAGKLSCNDTLKAAMSLWGEAWNGDYADDSDSLLCNIMDNANLTASVIKPNNWFLTSSTSCSDSMKYSELGDYVSYNLLYDSGVPISSPTGTAALNGFTEAVKQKVYGGNDISFDPAGDYLVYLNALWKGCQVDTSKPLSDDEVTTMKDNGSDANRVYENINTVDSNGNKSGANYSGDAKSDKHDVFPEKNSYGYLTCADIASGVNKSVDAYVGYISTNPKDKTTANSSNSSPSDGKATCGSSVPGVGWILCPLITGITGLNDAMWKLVSGFLTINPLNQTGSIYSAWESIRSIANVVFVIFFLIIIFSQLTSVGISNYGIKKLLPRLIICAILVNVSFVLIQVVVDLSNIVGSSIYNILTSMVEPITATWSTDIDLLLSGTGLAVVGVGAASGIATGFWMLLPMAIMGLLGIFAAFLTLIVRQAAIPILAILAPLAIVMFMLPNTETWFKKWKDLLVPMILMYPLASVLFGGCRFAASVIISANPDDFLQTLIGLVVMTLPLFSLPFLVKQSGPLLSKVGGAINKAVEKARTPIKDFSKSHEDLARARYLSQKPNSINPMRRASQFLNNSRKTREVNTKAYNDKIQDNWNTAAEKKPAGSAGQAYLRSRAFAPSNTNLENNWEALKTGKVQPNSDLNKALKKVGYTQQQLVDSTNKEQAHLQSSAISKNIHAENYAKEIQNPRSGLITTAAGVDTTYGAARVQAAAQSTIDEARNKNVNAAKLLFANQAYSTTVSDGNLSKSGDLIKVIVNGKLKNQVDNATPEQMEAAIIMLGETGSPFAYEMMVDKLSALPNNTDEEKQLKTRLQQTLKSVSDIRGPKAIGGSAKGSLASGDLTDTFQNLEIKLITGGKLSAQDWPSIKNDETTIMTRAISNPNNVIDKNAITKLLVDINTAFSDERIYNNIPEEQKVEMKKLRTAAYARINKVEPNVPDPRNQYYGP